VSALPFAVGLYLPISTSTPIFIGGVIRYVIDRRSKASATEAEFSPGVLLSSGLIAGGAIAGLCQATVQGFGWDALWDKSHWLGPLASSEVFAIVVFGLLAFFLLRVASPRNNKPA
jgi:hypothetical protein